MYLLYRAGRSRATVAICHQSTSTQRNFPAKQAIHSCLFLSFRCVMFLDQAEQIYLYSPCNHAIKPFPTIVTTNASICHSYPSGTNHITRVPWRLHFDEILLHSMRAKQRRTTVEAPLSFVNELPLQSSRLDIYMLRLHAPLSEALVYLTLSHSTDPVWFKTHPPLLTLSLLILVHLQKPLRRILHSPLMSVLKWDRVRPSECASCMLCLAH